MVSLTKHHVPEWFHEWLNEYYTFRTRPVSGEANAICGRCGDIIWHLTKHARNVHGDDVELIPGTPRHAADGWFSDEQGHLIRAQEEAQAVR